MTTPLTPALIARAHALAQGVRTCLPAGMSDVPPGTDLYVHHAMTGHVHVGDVQADVLVLAIQAPVVVVYQPGPWEARLEAWTRVACRDNATALAMLDAWYAPPSDWPSGIWETLKPETAGEASQMPQEPRQGTDLWQDAPLSDDAPGALQGLREVVYDKTALNRWVQHRWDALMQEETHGYYETLFRVVHEAIRRVVGTQAREEGDNHA